jgi:hypothetical protein
MINISYEEHPDLYFDYRLGLNLLRSVKDEDYSYPDEVVNFHVYTEVKTEKELECIKSYLATQNLEKTKLILWSDFDISDNKLLDPYRSLLDCRVYDAAEEAKGTSLEDHSVWISGDTSDTKHYMKSGILRFLVTHKYGGVWADMDMVLLRDFKPILDQEWAYMWGGEVDFANFGPCAAMMNFKKQSQHSAGCLEEICTTPIHKDSTILDHMLLAKVYRKNPFTVFPSTFFNTEWLISKVDRQLSEDLENDWFYNKKDTAYDYLFLEAFAWHWHNSSKKTFPIEEGSKFDLLRIRTNELLKQKGIL